MSHHESLFVNIKRYRKNQQFCDITFDVMGTKFHLHKLVISSASNFFEAMFTKDVIKPDQKEVALKGVTPSAFEGCIDFIYEGTTNIEEDGIDNLFHAATLFQLEVLMKKCIDQIRNITHVKNCVKFYQLSLKEECQEIEEKSKDVMLKNAENILTDDSIISTMDEESLSMMLKSDELNISDESVAFQALVKWTDMDKERMDAFCELLQFVRLPVVSREFFTSVVHKNEHIQRKCTECKDYALQTMLHLVDGKDHGLKQEQFEVRRRLLTDTDSESLSDVTDESEDASDKASSIDDVANSKSITPIKVDVDIMMINNDCKSFKLFDVENNLLTDNVKLNFLPVDTACRALINHNDKIYVMGECNGQRSYYCDYRRERTWRKLPQMPNNHNGGLLSCYQSSVVCFYDKILVVGGLKDLVASKFVSCFCTQTNTWSKFPSLDIRRYGAATVMAGEHVYAIGGFDRGSKILPPTINNGRYLLSVEKYQSGQWESAPSLNIARLAPAAVYHNKKIFVAGGYNTHFLTSVETLSEGDSSWTEIVNLNVGRSDASMFTYNGNLYIFGGEREKSNLYETWCDTSNKWELSEMEDKTIQECKVLLCEKGIKRC